MNYAQFYDSAKRILVDSLVSLWVPGKKEEQDYLRYLLTEKEPLLAEPVFQSVFPWEASKWDFQEHASKLGILDQSFVDALSDSSLLEEYQFPKNRFPFKHQTKSWENMLSGDGKTIVVTSGTGSGKTECFMIPVLQDLNRINEKGCVQAIFLYPLNALMKSQEHRIGAWCNILPHQITYAIYNGDTEKEDKKGPEIDGKYPQLVTRPRIRRDPPQILFTNPTMLNYMLVRAEDRSVLQRSQGKLRWILLDEAHTYTGSSAAELALQIRRVLDAFGVNVDQVNFAVTSATIGDTKDPKTIIRLKTFVSQLTGKNADSIVVIDGKRVIPDLDKTRATTAINEINKNFQTSFTLNDILKLRKKLNSEAVLKTTEIAKCLDKKIAISREKSLELIDRLGNKCDALTDDGKDAALLPSRIHFFIRSLGGIYACVNPDCERDRGKRLDIGSLTSFQATACPSCKSQLLELAVCSSCGGLIIVGENGLNEGFRMKQNMQLLDNQLFYEREELPDSTSEQNEKQNTESESEIVYRPFYCVKLKKSCNRNNASNYRKKFNFETGKIEQAKENESSSAIFTEMIRDSDASNLCPHCGNHIKDISLDFLRASATFLGRTLATLILDNAEAKDADQAEVLYQGKKYITFTDNRQGSARSAMGINQDVERNWIRSAIFHRLADLRLDEIQQGGELTNEEIETIKQFEQNPHLLALATMRSVYDGLIAKRDGIVCEPSSKEVNWNDCREIFENNENFKKLFKHLSEAKSKYFNLRDGKPSDYLSALFLDQFGWIPKRSNTLENMGMVRLVYPTLKGERCPANMVRLNFTDEDWRNFLKICVDYFIRANRHYMISSDNRDFLTQTNYCVPIYPSDSAHRVNGKPVHRWPILRETMGRKVIEEQSRIVLLLCAALDITNIDAITEEQKVLVSDLLTKAWRIISSKVLEPVDEEHCGYKLNLLGNKVQIQLIEEAWLCPVDNVVVDTIFKGYSPRIYGYISLDTFKRYKVKEHVHYPMFPFHSMQLNEKAIEQWMIERLSQQAELGILGNIQKGIYARKPIFLAAEHSAQQDHADLEKYEKDFNNGKLNILSCSTTMEMGVDIGGISEVVMNNVPPKPANYLQRAGRAGRRNETKAMAITFCAPNPIGSHTWENPDWPMTHITAMPLIKLESTQLIQRHINALLFANYINTLEEGIKVTSHLSDFFGDTNQYYISFLNYLSKIMDEGYQGKYERSYQCLVYRTIFEKKNISDAAHATYQSISDIYNIYSSRLSALKAVIKEAETADGKKRKKSAGERRCSNFQNLNLLAFLAENSFLPSAGIPTGLVECILNYSIEDQSKHPTMHLSQAISSYAPGSIIVKNEWCYEPAGIRLRTKYDNHTTRYSLQYCHHCGYTSITYGNPQTDCPKCGSSNTMLGLKGIGLESNRFTEIVEPAAFAVDYAYKPTRKITPTAMHFIQPVLLEMEKLPEKASNAKMLIRTSTPSSEILFYNPGSQGYGYAFCPHCGRMVSEKKQVGELGVLDNHKHLETNLPCLGGQEHAIRRHVLLVGRYQTDFVEIKFYDEKNCSITNLSILYSLGVIMSRKLTEILGVNDGEIDFGYNSNYDSIFIYDTALGGAGYSLLLREYKDKVLDLAYKALDQCKCERACTKCLIDRKSQWYLNYLDRNAASQWLKMERDSRTAPVEILAEIPTATTVTTDFTTEFYQLSRDNNLAQIRFYISNEVEEWDAENFPLGRTISDLKSNGVKVSFVVEKDIDFANISIESMPSLMHVLFNNDFEKGHLKLNGHLKPLAQITYNDNHTKLFFSKKVIRSFDAKWGDGILYMTDYIPTENYSVVQPFSVLQPLLEGENDFMFDTYIRTDATTDNIFATLQNNDVEKWIKIKNALLEKTIDITYRDRYLVTPLSCLLFAKMIRQLQDTYKLKINTLSVYMTIPMGNNYSSNGPIGALQNFTLSGARNKFLINAVCSLTGIQPNIIDTGYIEHNRCLSIIASDFECCIRPDAGIGHGWSLFGYKYDNLTSEDMAQDWEAEYNLYNKEKRGDGILYTIAFKLS